MSQKRHATIPFSLRLTPQERQRLEDLAGGMSMASYARKRLFDDDATPNRTHSKTPVEDHKALAQLLGLLGQSGLADSLSQLARAAQSGSLPLTSETEAALRAACRAVQDMRRLLMTALGIKDSR